MHAVGNDGNSSVWLDLSRVSPEQFHTDRPLAFDVKSPFPSGKAGVCAESKHERCWVVRLRVVERQEQEDGLLLTLPLGRVRQLIEVEPPWMRVGPLQVVPVPESALVPTGCVLVLGDSAESPFATFPSNDRYRQHCVMRA